MHISGNTSNDEVLQIAVENGILALKEMIRSIQKGNAYLPEGAAVVLIEGGNHAQFGNYGEQKAMERQPLQPRSSKNKR